MWFWIALGSAIGGLLRYSLLIGCARHLAWPYPWTTLMVNVLGSLLIGFLATAYSSDRATAAGPLPDVLILGVLGGFTTFSSFSLQTLHLLQQRSCLTALFSSSASVGLCVAAAALGTYLAQVVFR